MIGKSVLEKGSILRHQKELGRDCGNTNNVTYANVLKIICRWYGVNENKDRYMIKNSKRKKTYQTILCVNENNNENVIFLNGKTMKFHL